MDQISPSLKKISEIICLADLIIKIIKKVKNRENKTKKKQK